ncbi:restriction endonuclease subunit S [Hanamia caeni]|uniref:Restriction endonuclease subunit S n=1 Tax=Hanamia caeni TaxID=2294116 RepID=A0A3M9N613_9BACT|nr:restriction endonuclease subunit S [Hanamia caeni]RNI32825.1 restriction endonuclease subunit S [Hanamia caeni]
MSKEIKSKIVPKLRFSEFKDDGEWDEKTLAEISSAIFDGTHQTPKYIEKGIPFFSVENVVSGNKNKFISQEDYLIATTKNKPEKGDILITRIGNIGFSKIVDWDFEFSIYVTLAVVKKSKRFDSYYLHSFFQSDYYQNEIRSKSLLNAVPCKINMDELRKSKVLLPDNIAEQQKIASCLSSLDEYITAESQKLEALKTHKKGLMQQLFPAEGERVPKLRFPEFKDSGEWKIRELNEFITERNESPINKTPLYSLTIENGVTPKTERYERAFLVKDEEDAYKIVYPNDFAYNPMNLRFGAIARHAGNEIVALSKYYNIFHCDYSVDSKFCDIYFRSYGMITHYNDIATGSLIEKRRVHFSNFLKIKIHFPTLGEQQKIASCLSSLDDLITSQTEKIEALKEHKKGLMQGLFPETN